MKDVMNLHVAVKEDGRAMVTGKDIYDDDKYLTMLTIAAHDFSMRPGHDFVTTLGKMAEMEGFIQAIEGDKY